MSRQTASDAAPTLPASPESADERDARHRARTMLLGRLRERLGDGEKARWLEASLAAVAGGDPTREPRAFDIAFGLAPRGHSC